MATVSNPNAAVVAGNGIGPVTYIYAVATGTTAMADAVTLATTTYGGTVAGVEGTTGTAHLIVQGGPGGLEADAGVTLVATIDQNPA